jgi:uncharacterized cupredoxin-like copper-binding protein
MKTRFLLAVMATGVAGLVSAAVSADEKHHGHGAHAHHAAHASAAGKPGMAAAVRRTIKVVMLDSMRYEPSSITVKAGETVRFVVENKGKLTHEFGIGTPEEQAAHAEMMQAMPGMKHDEPNVITVEPGETKALIWQFTKPGTFEIACHVPGHYPAGMKMTVTSAK